MGDKTIMKKFRITALVLAALTALCLLVSCGAKNYDGISFDIKALGEHIAANGTFEDELIQSDYLSFAFSEGSEFVSWFGTGATPEEIIVVDAKSADGAASALAVLNEHLADQKVTFTDYNSWEKPKLNDALVMTAGNYAVYAVSADNAALEEIVTDWLDAQVK